MVGGWREYSLLEWADVKSKDRLAARLLGAAGGLEGRGEGRRNRLRPAGRGGHLDGVDDAVAVVDGAPKLLERRVVPRAAARTAARVRGET